MKRHTAKFQLPCAVKWFIAHCNNVSVVDTIYILFNFITDPEHSRLNPQPLLLEIGASDIFKCNSHGHTQWFFEEKNELPNNAFPEFSQKQYVLKFENVNLLNYGKYQCYGWDDINKKNFLAETEMRVYGEV